MIEMQCVYKTIVDNGSVLRQEDEEEEEELFEAVIYSNDNDTVNNIIGEGFYCHTKCFEYANIIIAI